MTRQVQLVLVIHNHQPVGNFDHVFEDACERAYLPFLRTLREFPAVRVGLHTSGCLWEWVEANRRDYGELVDELLAAGQLELLGGGMYEPILPILPYRDALRQLRRLSDFLEQRFGTRPNGAWIAERVWEPQLPEVLAEAGLQYCLLDDYHFEGNAPADDIATEYFTTRHVAAEVALLPISKELRYAIPFKPAEETIAYLRNLAENTGQVPLSVFGDDGEKFGIWPDTHNWVYEQGWLRSFFQALTDNQAWIQVKLPSEVLAERSPAGSVFIPSRSYYEMGEWTSIGGDQPGHWRNFLNKYPEARQVYERMVEVSSELNDAGTEVPAEAWDDLGRAQCNCSYWHGVFGGLYLNYLRQAVTHNLLKAERAVQPLIDLTEGNASTRKANAPIRLHNEELSLTLDPAHGLAVSRIDYYPTLFNWCDVLSRRTEAYHQKLVDLSLRPESHNEEYASIHDIVRVKEPGLEQRLLTDPHPRHSFVTYLSTVESQEQFLTTKALSLPMDAVDWNLPASYERRENSELIATLRNGDWGLSKSIRLLGPEVNFGVKTSHVPNNTQGYFYVEFNLTVLTDQAEDRYMLVDTERWALNQGGSASEIQVLALVDEWQQRRAVLEPSLPARLITYPVYTVSSSEAGFERTYQGTCIMLGFDPADVQQGITITLRIEEL